MGEILDTVPPPSSAEASPVKTYDKADGSPVLPAELDERTITAANNSSSPAPNFNNENVVGIGGQPFTNSLVLAPDYRDLRIKILNDIVNTLERKKPNWEKARILHLSTQLEESMFMTQHSLALYGDASTLGTRINEHCLLLANRKRAEVGDSLHPTQLPQSVGQVQAMANSSVQPLLVGNAGYGQTPGDSYDPQWSGPARPCPQVLAPTEDEDESEPEVIKVSRGAVPAGVVLSKLDWVGAQQQETSTSVKTQIQEIKGNGWIEEDEEEVLVLPSLPLSSSPSSSTLFRAGGVVSGTVTSHAGLMTSPIAVSDQGQEPAMEEAIGINGVVELWAVPNLSSNGNTDMRGYAVGGATLEEGEERGVRVSSSASSVSSGATSIGTMNSSVTASSNEGGAASSASETHADYGQGHKEEVKRHALRLLQCRMLLLSHSTRCTQEEGECQLSPRCDSVRQLLHHMQSCKHRESATTPSSTCHFPHCASSTTLLQHHRVCQSSGCRLCLGVRELSQRCFWASARHAHKRRLQESHEFRRKQRQREGKAITPPRKPQSERAKNARELCSGLDEKGNDLGDISLGFFLRQEKASKARKLSEGPSTALYHNPQENPAPDAVVPDPVATPMDVDHDSVEHGSNSNNRANPATPVLMMQLSSHSQGLQVPDEDDPSSQAMMAHAGVAAASGSTLTLSMGTGVHPAATQSLPSCSSLRSACLQTHTHALPINCTSDAAHDQCCSRKEDIDMDIAGGGVEALSVMVSSGGERGAAARAGGFTVVIPPADAVKGSLKTPPEILLDEIAVSLRDSTRQPSFAKIQSVQAFLNEHTDLRESPSFGDVCAMVGQWANPEDGPTEDEQMLFSSAFSF